MSRLPFPLTLFSFLLASTVALTGSLFGGTLAWASACGDAFSKTYEVKALEFLQEPGGNALRKGLEILQETEAYLQAQNWPYRRTTRDHRPVLEIVAGDQSVLNKLAAEHLLIFDPIRLAQNPGTESFFDPSRGEVGVSPLSFLFSSQIDLVVGHQLVKSALRSKLARGERSPYAGALRGERTLYFDEMKAWTYDLNTLWSLLQESARNREVAPLQERLELLQTVLSRALADATLIRDAIDSALEAAQSPFSGEWDLYRDPEFANHVTARVRMGQDLIAIPLVRAQENMDADRVQGLLTSQLGLIRRTTLQHREELLRLQSILNQAAQSPDARGTVRTLLDNSTLQLLPHELDLPNLPQEAHPSGPALLSPQEARSLREAIDALLVHHYPSLYGPGGPLHAVIARPQSASGSSAPGSDPTVGPGGDFTKIPFMGADLTAGIPKTPELAAKVQRYNELMAKSRARQITITEALEINDLHNWFLNSAQQASVFDHLKTAVKNSMGSGWRKIKSWWNR